MGGEHSTYIIRFEALCSQQPFRVYWGGGGTFYLHHPLWGLITHSSHLCSQVYWGWGGDILLTSSALRPYAHSSHLGFIGVGGGTFYLHHPLSSLHSSHLGFIGVGGRPDAHSSHLGFIGVGGNIPLTSSALRPYARRVVAGFGAETAYFHRLPLVKDFTNITNTTSLCFHWISTTKNGRFYFACSCDLRRVVAISSAETACFHRLPLVKDFTNVTNTTSLCFHWISLLKMNVSTSRVVAIFGV